MACTSRRERQARSGGFRGGDGGQLGGSAAAPPAGAPAGTPAAKKAAGKFTVVSPDIGQGKTIAEDQVFNGFGCKGKNLSPALFWSGAPAGHEEFRDHGA